MEVKEDVLRTVEDAIKGISFGSITLIIQDGKLIQMDKTERIRFVIDKGKNQPTLAGKAVSKGLRNKVQTSLEGLQFGQVAFAIKDGVIVQIERTEKRRVPSLEGIYGEGI